MKEKLEEFRNLEKDWNGYGAEPIREEVIEAAKDVCEEFHFGDTEVFPTGRRTVQFEIGPSVELEVMSESEAECEAILLVYGNSGVKEYRTTLEDAIQKLKHSYL